MPTLDEPALRHFLHRATDDLCAPAYTTGVGANRPRPRRRTTVAVTSAVAVAAAAAVGVVVVQPGAGHVTTTGVRNTAPAQATPAQRILYRLASVTKTAPVAPGAATRSASRDSFTSSQLAALPTEAAALRAALLTAAVQAKALAADKVAQARAEGAVAAAVAKVVAASRAIAAASPNEEVFTQAADVLVDPQTSPALRAAVYRLLAVTPGITVAGLAAGPVRVVPGVTDPGRSAVRISALTGTRTKVSVVVSATTGTVIRSALTYPPGVSSGTAPFGDLSQLLIRPTGAGGR